jgi:hypothetical protein
MRDVLEQEPPAPPRGRRALLFLVGLGVAALVVPRLITAVGGSPAESPPPPPAAVDRPVPVPPVRFPSDRIEPIDHAPLIIRMIELVSADRLTLFHGQLGDDTGRTTVTGAKPFATDDLIVQEYGVGVVIGPAPGSSAPGQVRGVGAGVLPPSDPVAGILPALDGGYWIMNTTRTAAGACQMQLVMLSGHVSDSVVTYPCDFVPERETIAGFVGTVGPRVSPTSGTLLDRETGALEPIGGSLFGAAADYLVRWTRDLSDPVVVEDLVDGGIFEVQLPGRGTRQVELSPDGRYLAVVFTEQLVSVRSYEVWVYDLVNGGGRMATVTTLDDSPLELAWRADVLVVVGNDVEAYDAVADRLYQSTLGPMPERLDAVAMPFELQRTRAPAVPHEW